jgi:hypothetical protein
MKMEEQKDIRPLKKGNKKEIAKLQKQYAEEAQANAKKFKDANVKLDELKKRFEELTALQSKVAEKN